MSSLCWEITFLLKGNFPKIQRHFLSQFFALFFTLKYQSQKEHLCVHTEVGSKILFFMCPQVCFFCSSLSIKILCLIFFCISCSSYLRPIYFLHVLVRLLRTYLGEKHEKEDQSKASWYYSDS